MSTEQNKSIVRRYIEEVLNQGNVDVADEIIAVGYVGRSCTYGSEQERSGLDRIKQFAGEQRTAAPDWHITIEEMIAEGDKVVVRAFGSGTPQRVYSRMPAEAVGKRITVPWIAIYRLEKGKIVEAWVLGDRLGVLQQAGVISA